MTREELQSHIQECLESKLIGTEYNNGAIISAVAVSLKEEITYNDDYCYTYETYKIKIRHKTKTGESAWKNYYLT